MIKLSIIIPLYNTEDYILETLDSIINQNLNNIEVIVIDDASSDKGPDLVKAYCQKFPYIQLINNTRQKGVSGARNTGILQAKGKYIAFIDSDDVFLDNALSQNLQLLDEHPDVNFLSSDFVKFKHSNEIDTPLGFYAEKKHIMKGLTPFKHDEITYLIPDPIKFYIDVTCPMVVGSVVIRRTHLKHIGLFDETLSQGEDMELWYRLTVNQPLLYNNQASMAYRIRDDSAISNTHKRHQGMCQFITQIYNNPLFKAYKKGLYFKVLEEHLNYIYYCRENALWFEGLKQCLFLLSIKPYDLIIWRQILAIISGKK